MLIGYARVSTRDQSLNLQEDALKKAGCQKIFKDVASGAKEDRFGLDQALKYARPEDVLVVWRLDRLGRTLKHVIEFVTRLEKKGIGFKSLTESIDTSSSGGNLIFHIFAALSEFERNVISERTKAGLKAARVRGKLGGRPKKLTSEKWKLAKKLYDEKELKVNQICEIVGISRQSFYNYLRKEHKN